LDPEKIRKKSEGLMKTNWSKELLQSVKGANSAMIIRHELRKAVKILEPNIVIRRKVGGIDLTPVNINLQTRSSGEGIKFHINSGMLAKLRNISGFTPVVTNIQPIEDLPLFLGLKQDGSISVNS